MNVLCILMTLATLVASKQVPKDDDQFCVNLDQKLYEELELRNSELQNVVRRWFVDKADEAIGAIDRALGIIRKSSTASGEGRIRAQVIATAAKNFVNSSPITIALIFNELRSDGVFKRQNAFLAFCHKKVEMYASHTTEMIEFMNNISNGISEATPDNRCDAIIHDFFESLESIELSQPDIFLAYRASTSYYFESIQDELYEMGESVGTIRFSSVALIGSYIIDTMFYVDGRIFAETFGDAIIGLDNIDDAETVSNSDLGIEMHHVCSINLKYIDVQRNATLTILNAAIEKSRE